MLALRANRTVAADELIDGLWADHPPASAAKNLQSYVSELRKALASDGAGASIVSRGRGYELRVAEEAVDALRFEDLVEEAARQPRGAGANGLAGAALELWRGAPLADVASEPFAAPEIGRLEELHMRAIELAIEAELAAGRHAEVVARLEALIAEEPLRERLHAQRMLALYRAGRQSEALEAYHEARAALIEQIGVEPGPELKRLQEQILAQDPALEAPPPTVELPVQLEGGSPLLAGRERELDWLRRRWARAREGRIVCVMVWGPAGIGKTRLRRRARGRGPARGRRGPLCRRWRGRRGGAGDRSGGRHGPPTDASGVRLRQRRPPERARGRRGARPRARGSAAHGLRPSSRRAGPARLRRLARERSRPTPAPRPA